MADDKPAAKKLMEPVGAPPSPPYANGYIVHRDGDVVTLLFMRIPPAYTDAQQAAQQDETAFNAPVVSSVTLSHEGARNVIKLLTDMFPPKAE